MSQLTGCATPVATTTPAEVVRTVTTEIQCEQGDLYLWVTTIGYGDHRFYEDIQNRKRVQPHLRTQFIAGEALNLLESGVTDRHIGATP